MPEIELLSTCDDKVRGSAEQCLWLHEAVTQLPMITFPFTVNSSPTDGIYFFYERGENWGHGDARPKVVRVGTHKNGNFRSRIAEHYVFDDRRMNFNKSQPAPKDRSIFRKNLGRSLIVKHKLDYLSVWEIDFTTKQNVTRFSYLRNIPQEQELEREISNILRTTFSFRVISVREQAARMGPRGLESQLIATFAQCELCRPSENWLGRFSPERRIRESGLWQVQHLKSTSLTREDRRRVQDIISASA